MRSNQFLEEAVHDLAFGVQFDFTHQLTSIFDKFPNAGFIWNSQRRRSFSRIFFAISWWK